MKLKLETDDFYLFLSDSRICRERQSEDQLSAVGLCFRMVRNHSGAMMPYGAYIVIFANI